MLTTPTHSMGDLFPSFGFTMLKKLGLQNALKNFLQRPILQMDSENRSQSLAINFHYWPAKEKFWCQILIQEISWNSAHEIDAKIWV